MVSFRRRASFTTFWSGLRERKGAGIARLLPLGITVLSLCMYLSTLAPTITWRHYGADSGDLATAVAVLGIPHPPGYPSYVLLGRAWLALPVGGDIAYHLNVLSACAGALAAGLAVASGLRLTHGMGIEGWPAYMGPGLAGLALAVSPLYWSQAIITEVYAPGMAWLALLTYLLVLWYQTRRPWLLAGVGLVWGAGCGALPLIALVLPGMLFVLMSPAAERRVVRSWLAGVAGASAGLLVFVYLPVRASARPTLNWGDPSTWDRLWAVISAQIYRVYWLRDPSAVRWLMRLGESLAGVAYEVGWLSAVLAIVGAVRLWLQRCGKIGAYLVYIFAIAVLFRTSYQVNDSLVYLLPAVVVLAILAGAGTAWILEVSRARGGRSITVALVCALALVIAGRVPVTARTLNLRGDDSALRYATTTLAALPPNALLISDRDETTFSLWYAQALGKRADVVVVDSRLLFFDWYQRALARQYPDLDLRSVRPGGLTGLGRPIFSAEWPGPVSSRS